MKYEERLARASEVTVAERSSQGDTLRYNISRLKYLQHLAAATTNQFYKQKNNPISTISSWAKAKKC